MTFGSPLVANHIYFMLLTGTIGVDIPFILQCGRTLLLECIMFVKLLSIERELQQVLEFLNRKSNLYKHSSFLMSAEASYLVENVSTKLSSVAGYVACNLYFHGKHKFVSEKLSGLMELSLYRPFRTFKFSTEIGRMVVEKN